MRWLTRAVASPSLSGVRKHARKTHAQWLKNVDAETSLRRDQRRYGSKPSTYCILEVPEPTLAPSSFLAPPSEAHVQDANSELPRNPMDSPAAQAVAAFLVHETAQLPPGAVLPSLNMLPAFEAVMAGRRHPEERPRLLNEPARMSKRARAELDSIPLERLQTPLEIETLFDEEGLRLAQEKQEAHAPHSSPNSSSDELSAVDSVTTSVSGSQTPPTAVMPRPNDGGEVSPFDLSRQSLAGLGGRTVKQLPASLGDKLPLQDDFVKSFMAGEEIDEFRDEVGGKDAEHPTFSSSNTAMSADEEAFFATLFAS